MNSVGLNHISFKAHFAASLKGQCSDAYYLLDEREENIRKEFANMTKNDKTHRLMENKCRGMGSDEFTLWKKTAKEETLVSKIRVDFTKDLKNMTDKEAAKRLVDIMQLMKTRGQQNQVINNMINKRDVMISKKNKEISEAREKQNNQFINEMENKKITTDSISRYLAK